MLGKLLTTIRDNIVGDLPDEVDACYDCGVAQCAEDQFRHCPNRLARAEALRKLRAAEKPATP